MLDTSPFEDTRITFSQCSIVILMPALRMGILHCSSQYLQITFWYSQCLQDNFLVLVLVLNIVFVLVFGLVMHAIVVNIVGFHSHGHAFIFQQCACPHSHGQLAWLLIAWPSLAWPTCMALVALRMLETPLESNLLHQDQRES